MSDNAIVFMVFSICFLLIMPIFCNVNLFFDVKKNKYYFGIFLFKFVKLYGGYFQFFGEGIVFHLSKNKAAILPFDKVIESKGKFEITNGFEILRFHQIIEIGSSDDIEVPLYVSAVSQAGFGIIYGYYKLKKHFINLKSSTLLVEDEDVIKISANIVAAFNMVVLFIAMTKIILEKLFYNDKRKRSKA